MKRIALFLTLAAAGLALASYAAAGPDPGKDKDKGKGKAHAAAALSCTGKPKKLELKGTIESVGTDSFVMTVKKANHLGKSLKGTQLTVQLTADTKITRKGHAQASDLAAGDKVKVHGWTCITGTGPTAAATGAFIADKVDAHPAKPPKHGGTTTTATTTATTTETTTTAP
jgi:Domain of unknown function (DUF5666)